MGNVCSSGQNKKKDSISDKSEDSYKINRDDGLKQSKEKKSATELNIEELPSAAKDTSKCVDESVILDRREKLEIDDNKNEPTSNFSTNSTGTKSIPSAEVSDTKNISVNYLSILQGKSTLGRKLERVKKIVIYILSDCSAENKKHKRVIFSLQKQLTKKCQAKGFEILFSDVHDTEVISNGSIPKLMQSKRWTHNPLVAQGGHEEAANSLSEITRHSSSAYIIPVIFLGSTLGIPMLPLTIESQDFTQVLTAATDEEKLTLEKWYIIDNCYQPMCHRLNTDLCKEYLTDNDVELNNLFDILMRLFSDDIKDSYMSTVVEQEINNTVLMSQELAKRCIWIQTGQPFSKNTENATPYEQEISRRMSKLFTDLKMHLSEKNLVRIISTMSILDEELAAVIENLLVKSIDCIIEEHITKCNMSSNTNGIDHILLEELEHIGHFSKVLAQNSPNFDIMTDVKR